MSGLQLNDDNIRDIVEKYISGDTEITRYGPIGNWDVSNVTNMSELFQFLEFNEDISNWNVSNVRDMSYMFDAAENFNQPLDSWNVTNVTNMSYMFEDATNFNQPLDSWNVSNVKQMSNMFKRAETFNQPLDRWNVSKVAKMDEMFYGAEKFNQPLNSWDVSKVYDMTGMFADAKDFNQPLNNWNVSNVHYMMSMFENATNFNQPLNRWDVSNVINMDRMFKGAIIFNQPLNNWIIGPRTNTEHMFLRANSMEEENKPRRHTSRSRRLPSLTERNVRQNSINELLARPTLLSSQPQPSQEPSESVNFSTENDCYDIINGEDISVKQALEDENIVFVFYTDDIKRSSRVAIPIQAVTDALKPENLNSYIIYQCIIAGTMTQNNINTTKPYFDIKKLTGFGDLIELESIVFTQSTQKIYIFKQSNERLVSTVSYDILFRRASPISGRHCQEGQGATIYKLVSFTLTSDPVGGRKRTSVRKRRSSTRKRSSTRMKSVTRKTVTRKRKTKKNN